MKKKTPKKLQLHRETLSALQEPQLRHIAGGLVTTTRLQTCQDFTCNTCPDIDTCLGCSEG